MASNFVVMEITGKNPDDIESIAECAFPISPRSGDFIKVQPEDEKLEAFFLVVALVISPLVPSDQPKRMNETISLKDKEVLFLPTDTSRGNTSHRWDQRNHSPLQSAQVIDFEARNIESGSETSDQPEPSDPASDRPEPSDLYVKRIGNFAAMHEAIRARLING